MGSCFHYSFESSGGLLGTSQTPMQKGEIKTVAHFSVAFLFYVRNYCTKKAGIFSDKTPGYVTKKTYKQHHHDS